MVVRVGGLHRPPLLKRERDIWVCIAYTEKLKEREREREKARVLNVKFVASEVFVGKGTMVRDLKQKGAWMVSTRVILG